MNKLPILFIFCLCSILFAQNTQVTLADAQKVADRNARAMWGENLSPAPAIPYYGPDDKIIAYHFNYSLKGAFPSSSELISRSNQAFKIQDRDSGWGNDDYANIVIGANRGMPVIMEYSKCLSQQYALGARLDSVATRVFPKGYKITRTYYLGMVDVWYCLNDGTETRYINLEPYPIIKTSAEFTELLRTMNYYWIGEDYEADWQNYLDNEGTITRNDVWIPGLEQMPFYQWSYGCVPTAAAMLLAWWDNYHGFGKLVKYHLTRYDNIQEENDSHVPSILPRLAHNMNTGATSGNTDPWDIDDGINASVSEVGYQSECDGIWGLYESLTFYVAAINSIDNNRPCLVTISAGTLMYHTITGVGYGDGNGLFHVYDSNRSTVRTLNYTQLECHWWVHLSDTDEDYQFSDVDIIAPDGNISWRNENGYRETLYSGSYYEIRWTNNNPENTYARLYYHDEGGATSDRWVEITANTPNDGSYNWLVPDIDCFYGTGTEYGRIKVEIYSSISNELLSSDGSWGNFDILDGGEGYQTLGSDAILVEASPAYYAVPHIWQNTWGVLGVRDNPNNGYDIWDMELYDNPDFNDNILVETSAQVYDNINYIVIDNHQVPPAEWGLKTRCSAYWETAYAQFIGNPALELETGLAYTIDWINSDVARIWNVYLTPGDYYFQMDISNPVLDLNMELFRAGGDGIFTFREGEIASTNTGPGVSESFHYTATQAGYYGLCISARTQLSGSYSITINAAGKWTGLASTVWSNPANWSAGTVPSQDNDIIIPIGCPNYPVIDGGMANAAYSKTLTVEAGARLSVDNGYLNVYGDLHVFGSLRQTHSNSVVDVTGSVIWETNSSVLTTGTSTIYCYRNWTFKPDSDVLFANGNVVFVSDQDSYIESSSSTSQFNNLKIDKTGGADVIISENSESIMVVRGDLRIESGSHLRSESNCVIELRGLMVNLGNFQLDSGTVKFSGTNAYLECNAGDYFYNLDISTSALTAPLTSVYVHGDLTINSGGILASNSSFYIGGSWYDNMGTGGFNKGTSTVIFNGNGQSDCTGEDFYILEIANANCELHFDTGISTIDRYNWTAGTLYIEGGTLTINDLMDDGLFGTYVVHSGTLNVSQDVNHFVDLNGSLHIFGGNMNVYGGATDSYWPNTAHAWIEMYGGILDFKNVGIRINDSAYLLTTDIIGGIIRTSGSFSCYRNDFQVEGGVIELYGTGDTTLRSTSASYLCSLIINKSATRTDLRQDNTRSNTVSLDTDVHLNGDLVISTGTLKLNGHILTTDVDAEVYGNLEMTNAADVLSIGASLFWYPEATANVTSGEIRLNRWLNTLANSNFQLGTGNTFRFIGNESSIIFNQGNTLTFGSVIIDKSGSIVMNSGSTQPMTVGGNLTINAGSTLNISAYSITVNGNLVSNTGSTLSLADASTMVVGGNFTSDGELNITSSNLTCHNNFTLGTGGQLTLQSGYCILDKPYSGTLNSFSGDVIINGGIMEISDNGIQFGSASDFTMNSGTLRVGWDFTAAYAGTFQPLGGTVEFIGQRHSTVQMASGNYFHNLTSNKPLVSYQVIFSTDTIVNRDLVILGGNAYNLGHILTVNRDVIISNGRLTAALSAVTNVGRNWSNTVGPNGFTEGSGTVNFISDQTATISTETFYIVYINKTAATNNVITLNAGATMTVTEWLYLVFGCLQMGDNSILDANNNLTIMDGAALNLYSTSASNLLRLAGNLYDQNAVTSATTGLYTGDSGSLLLDGNADQTLSGTNARMYLGHVTVNKTGGKVKHSNQLIFQGNVNIISGEWSYAISGKTKAFNRDLIIETGGSFTDSTGTISFTSTNPASLKILGLAKFGAISFNKGSADVAVTLTGNATFTRSTTLVINSGTLNLNGFSLAYTGTFNIGSLGKLSLSSGSVLNLGNASVFNVNSGGQFVSLGSHTIPALVTSSGYYAFTANSGSSLTIANTTFEKMDTDGINLASGSYIDPDYCFTGCTFRNGEEGGSLLKINSQQTLIIWSAEFPANTWSGAYNVYRSEPTGSVTFRNYDGAFAGPDYDYNPNSNIIWEATAPPAAPQNLQINLDGSAAVLTWDPVPGATGYIIYRSFIPDTFTPEDIISTTDLNTYSDESILIYSKAFYMVKAYIE